MINEPKEVPPGMAPFVRDVRSEIENLNRLRISDLSSIANNNKGTAASLDALSRTFAEMAATQAQLAATQIQLGNTQDQLTSVTNRLVNASQTFFSDSGSNTWSLGTQTWADSPAPPSVTASSMSGRFRVTVQGAANNSIGAITFATTGLPRTRAIGSSAAAVRARATVGGGANYVATVSNSWIVSLNANTNYNFRAEMLNLTGNASFPLEVFSMSILVEPLY